jgi:predicted nucleotidyltransferase
MNTEIRNIIESIPNLSFAYLFGSRAKGTAKEESDYDVCIVINDNDKQTVFKTLTEFMLHKKIFIQPLVLTKDEFDSKIKIKIYKTEILDSGTLIVKK